jgi:N-acyl-D-amino-acid deacylase
MSLDLVVKNGLIVDGSGKPGYYGDVGVKDGRIVEIGRIAAPAEEVIDAEGHAVAPGFVDGHTHMDAQVFWDPLGTSSCYHGVTSVVMGNCGFTLAPCRKQDADLVFRNLERAEDISREALLAGIEWRWETFPQLLDVLDGLPKGINYATYIGHSALRTYVMGERAFTDAATADEVTRMTGLVSEAVTKGAIGFSTSRSRNHQTADDRPVASRLAEWEEMESIVRGMGKLGKGMLEIASQTSHGPAALDYYRQLAGLSAETGRPVTFGMFSMRATPGAYRPVLSLLEEVNSQGARLMGQVQSRSIGLILSFENNLPFDKYPVWKEFRALPLAEQNVRLRDPETRRQLVESARRPPTGPQAVGADLRPPEWDWFFLLDRFAGPHRSLADIARERGIDPLDAMLDLALESNLKRMFMQPLSNESEPEVLELLQHRHTVATFSDAGAHVSQIDTALQSHLLSHWVRERQAFTLEQAVKMITRDTARFWGFTDRGAIETGAAADIVVFDPKTVGPRMPQFATDLPAGARRILQYADGFLATVVNGRTVLKNGQPTGTLPGRLLRS